MTASDADPTTSAPMDSCTPSTLRQQVSRTGVAVAAAVCLVLVITKACYILYYDTQYLVPLCLTILSGLSTAVGALIVIFAQSPIDSRHLAYTAGLAAGVMTYVSLVDMLLPAVLTKLDSQSEVLLVLAIYTVGGIVLALLLEWMPDAELVKLATGGQDSVHSRNVEKGLYDTANGHTQTNGNSPNSIKTIKVQPAAVEIDIESQQPQQLIVPTTSTSPLISPSASGRNSRRSVSKASSSLNGKEAARTLRFGVLTAIVLAIHNLPEGLAVFISSVDSHTAGLLMAFAIALHNIAEGLVVAVPLYASTGSKVKTIVWTTASGVTEPIGALFSLAFLRSYLTHQTVEMSLVFVGGIMIAVSVLELIPEGVRYKQHTSLAGGIISGVVIMAGASWATS